MNYVQGPSSPRKRAGGGGVPLPIVPQLCFNFFIVRLCLKLLFQLLEEKAKMDSGWPTSFCLGDTPPVSCLHTSSPKTYFYGLRLSRELPLQVRDLVGRGLLQFLQRVLEVLHVLQQPQDLPILGSQRCFKPGARAQRKVHLILKKKWGFEGLRGVGQGVGGLASPPLNPRQKGKSIHGILPHPWCCAPWSDSASPSRLWLSSSCL